MAVLRARHSTPPLTYSRQTHLISQIHLVSLARRVAAFEFGFGLQPCPVPLLPTQATLTMDVSDHLAQIAQTRSVHRTLSVGASSCWS